MHALVRDDLPEDEEAAQVIQLAEGIVEDAELRACLDDRDHTGETSLFKSYPTYARPTLTPGLMR